MIIMIIFQISNTDWLVSWYTNTPVCYRQQTHSTGFGLKASFQDFKKRMKIERPRICKSCGSFHIVHIRQLEGEEGRSICICLIVCVCICICLCVSVFVFVFVLVYLYCSSAATGRREEDPPFFFIRCSFATRRPLWLLVGSRQGTSSHYQNSYLDLAV